MFALPCWAILTQLSSSEDNSSRSDNPVCAGGGSQCRGSIKCRQGTTSPGIRGALCAEGGMGWRRRRLFGGGLSRTDALVFQRYLDWEDQRTTTDECCDD